MPVVLGDIDHGLEHQNREGYSWDPGDEADNVEDREDEEDDSCTIPVSHEVYDRCANAKDNLKDTSDPDGSTITS
jgi:hypothetical protein